MAENWKYVHGETREICPPWEVILERDALPFKKYEDGSPVDDYFSFDKMMDLVNITDHQECWLIICEYKGKPLTLMLEFIYRPLLHWCVRQYGKEGQRLPKKEKEIPVVITGYQPLESKKEI